MLLEEEGDQFDENQFIVTPNDRIFKTSELSSPFADSKLQSAQSFKLSDEDPHSIESVKVETASLILDLNESALVAFNKDEIEKAFLSFKKCQGLLSKRINFSLT